jgi:hypothetical protein
VVAAESRLERSARPDDASLQHSSPLSGITTDPERTLDELFARYVTERAATPDREPRRDHEVWREMMSVLRQHGVLAGSSHAP